MDTTTLSSFGDLLKTLRKQSKVNQQELASRLGVHRNTISKWECGMYLPESKTIVLELARQLDLDPHDTRLLLEASLTALSPYWHLPYQRNPFFTGREEVLQRVHGALHQQQSALLSQSSALSGLGGIGKTQIAIEYAYRYANDYAAVFWISAETSESLTSSFLALAEILDLSERHEHKQQRVVSAVLRWLNSHSDWLLIFDNVEDIELVKGFLPSSRGGSLLFTSRRQALGITAQALDLHQMTLEEGMRLLLHRARLLELTASLDELDEHERAAARGLVALMDGLPLALDQAGAYIEATQCSLTDYLRLFQAASLKQLDEREAHADHPAPVARTFATLFERLERDQPLAAELLTVCAFLAPEAIPEELFVEGAAYLGPMLETLATDPLAFQRAIKALLSYSLLQRHADTHTLTIHRLVQVVLRERLSPDVQHIWVERVVRATAYLFPTDAYVQANYWQLGERLLPHALACLTLAEQWDEYILSLMNHVATYLYKRARYAEAQQFFECSLETGERILGPEHSLVAETLHGLAQLSLEQGQYTRAESLFQRAVQIREKALGADHPMVAASINMLGILYWKRGRHEQAELMLQRALHIWEQALGPDHPYVTLPLNNLSVLYYDQERYEQAEPLYLRVLHIREQVLGPDHPDIASPLNNLGNLYSAQGRYRQAELTLQRSLRIREQALGPDHPEVAYPLSNLGEVYYKQGQYEQAEPPYQRALRIWEQTLGPDHPNVAHPLGGLGNLYLAQGKYQQAEPFFQRALTIRQKHLSQQHPEVAETLYDLARLRQAQRQNTEALALYRQVLAIQEQVLGADHPKTRETRTAYAQLLREKETVEMEAQAARGEK
jgi:tetratricopeptide (TPR) repeat protein